MKRLLLVLTAISLLIYPVMAEEMCPDGHVCPEPSPEFGQHISDMTPTCPLEHGQMFGDCVSDMAAPNQ